MGLPDDIQFPGTPPQEPQARPLARPRSRWFSGLVELVRSLLLISVVFFLVRSVLLEAFKIPTSSMEGTLLAGDFLLVNKAVYGSEIPMLGVSLPAFGEPARGDVIVFHPPHEPDKHYVKRLVGLPGDTLQMKNKSLFVNGLRIEEPYVTFRDPDGDAVHPSMSWQRLYLPDRRTQRRYRPSRDNWGPLVVPSDRFFVLGDNRDNSEDSRYWGFVSREAIEGRPWMVYYSAEPQNLGGLWTLDQVRWDRIGGLIH